MGLPSGCSSAGRFFAISVALLLMWLRVSRFRVRGEAGAGFQPQTYGMLARVTAGAQFAPPIIPTTRVTPSIRVQSFGKICSSLGDTNRLLLFQCATPTQAPRHPQRRTHAH